jgi:hypothetical protein
MRRITKACRVAPAVLLMLGSAGTGLSAEPVTQAEEVVATCKPPGNGAGPLWCYGSPLIARQGDRVYASAMETGEGIPPLCNTRWRLFERLATGWRELRHDDDFRQREPCPLVSIGPGRLLLSVNPSTEPRGTKYGRCEPQWLVFDVAKGESSPRLVRPTWNGSPRFTDHSYRGISADPASGDVLALNIDAVTSLQHWSYAPADGSPGRTGAIQFPIRACYPQVALRDKAAHVLAIGDIVEPVEAWRTYKKQRTGADWDYVFRRLFYTTTPDIKRTDFAPPVEVDTVDATGGHITNLDVWIDPHGSAHLLYLKTTVAAVLRDKYFAGLPIATTLEHVVVDHGRVVRRATVLTGGQGKAESPLYGRFHAARNGSLHAVVAVSGITANGSPFLENRLVTLPTGSEALVTVKLGLKEPFTMFFTAAERGGNAPSDVLDLFGTGRDAQTLRYACIRLR